MKKERDKISLAVIKAAQENPARFSVIYDRFYKPIFVFIYKRVGAEELTADLTSQVFLKALLNLKKYEYRGVPFSSWLFRIAVNEVNLYFRKAKKEVHVPITESSLRSMAEEGELEDNSETLQAMVTVMNDLPEEQAQLLELRFFEHYSFRQLGDLFNISEDNAKVRVYRTLKKMKKMINLKSKGKE